MRRAIQFGLCAVMAVWASKAAAVQCQDLTIAGNSFTTCEIDPQVEDVRLFLYDQNDKPYGHFSVVDQALSSDNQRLALAMNGGMYHENRSPVGLYLENGKEIMRVVTNAGPGNFGLLPNGVFCVLPERARVVETLRFVKESPDCVYASQTGPMLVVDGELHPSILPDGTSRYIRNGVGASEDGKRLVFAISNNAVTFFEFAELFRSHLNLDQALYIDGNVSRLHAPSLGRSDLGRWMGPIVGVVEPKTP